MSKDRFTIDREQKCPRCKRFIESMDDGTYIIAERCKPCGWRDNFPIEVG